MMSLRLILTSILGLLIAGAVYAQQSPPLKIHMIAAGEYDPEKSLTEFKAYLEKHYRVEITTSFGNSKKLDNLDSLKSADLLFLFARRMTLSKEQMAIVRDHWEKGKPIVGLRTASHAFQKDDNEIFDKQVLGGNYGGASSNGGFKTGVAPGQENHPVLKDVGPIKASKYAYGQGKLADGVMVLHIVERIKDKQFPVTWVNTYKGGRVLYTSMGAPDDFNDANFSKLLVNAIFWTTMRDADKYKK